MDIVHEEVLEALYILGNVTNETIDFSANACNVRLRIHMYSSNHRPCAAVRLLYDTVLELERDRDVPMWMELCNQKEGLVLVTGPTGSGKSFALASCIDYINRHKACHIITMEDPVEYKFTNKKAFVHQRELGRDIHSMSRGLREAMREDPDVIMIGEMRDMETIEAALHAAETGHLVFATMHTMSAAQAIGRVLSAFPGNKQEEVRNVLSHVLVGVICQRLLRSDRNFFPLRDILLNKAGISNLIRQGKEHQIPSVQETNPPMQTFSMAIKKAQYINEEEGLGLCIEHT